jgi:hypothetical protein
MLQKTKIIRSAWGSLKRSELPRGENAMSAFIEQRRHERFTYEIPIIYYVDREQQACIGCMGNYSRGGIYFESNDRLQLKKPVEIRMHHPLADDPGPETHPGFIGEVIWFQKLSRDQSSYAFGYGIRFR